MSNPPSTKPILGWCHLMAESSERMAIQIYGVLIAALILHPLIGKRPGKRAMELMRMYIY